MIPQRRHSRYLLTFPRDNILDICITVQIFVISTKHLLTVVAFQILYQEACRTLPEICGPETYPKVAQVLLERENPETVLMVLRWSGRDGVSELVSVGEAVTAVRVRVECGILSEAFTYQRSLCLKVKENKLKNGAVKDV